MATKTTTPASRATVTEPDPSTIPIEQLPAFGDIPLKFFCMIETDCDNCKAEQEQKIEVVIDSEARKGLGHYNCSKCKGKNKVPLDTITIRRLYHLSMNDPDMAAANGPKKITTWKLLCLCGFVSCAALCAALGCEL